MADAATTLQRKLNSLEIHALSTYGTDSTFIHAVTQGWGMALGSDSNFKAFRDKCGSLIKHLDNAIAASELTAQTKLYSAHGSGFGVRGSLVGDPSRFVGLGYRYPGFLSTSNSMDFCRRHLDTRRREESQPTILKLEMPKGFNAVELRHGNHFGEFELLLGRNQHYRIIDAGKETGGTLSLTLTPEG